MILEPNIPPKVNAALEYVQRYWEAQGRGPWHREEDPREMSSKETSVKDAALELLSNYFLGETDDAMTRRYEEGDDDNQQKEPVKVPV